MKGREGEKDKKRKGEGEGAERPLSLQRGLSERKR